MKEIFKLSKIIMLTALIAVSLTTCGGGGGGGGDWDLDPELVGEWRSGAAITDNWVYNPATHDYSGITTEAGSIGIYESDGTGSSLQYNKGTVWGFPVTEELLHVTSRSTTKNGVMRTTNVVRYGNLDIPSGRDDDTLSVVNMPNNDVYYRVCIEGADTVIYISPDTPNPDSSAPMHSKSVKIK
ncbi:MAG: hypothetical protein FWG49_03950 [Leptospirales bacterium]|nr:hypothetical protein [Leptospirales bacterium]